MIDVKAIRIFFSAIFIAVACLPTVAQVTRIDTVKYTDTVLPKRQATTFNTDYLYTIGLKVYGYEQFPSVFNQSDDHAYFHTYVNGLMLGFNNNQMTYRLQASHYRNDGFASCQSCNEMSGTFTNTAFKIGFQYNVNYLRVQPYLGADLGMMLQRYESGYISEGEAMAIVDRKASPLFSPLLGVRAFILPRLSVAAEANFNVAYSSHKTTGTIDGDKTRYTWETFFSPVAGITLQYHFGSLTY